MSSGDTSPSAMFDQPTSEPAPTWRSHAIVAIAFLFFGFDKFSAGWDRFFAGLPFPPWFRTLTALTEILGAILVLIPRTAQFGLFLLSATMFSAVLIWIFLMHSPASSVFPAVILLALLAFWKTQRDK